MNKDTGCNQLSYASFSTDRDPLQKTLAEDRYILYAEYHMRNTFRFYLKIA